MSVPDSLSVATDCFQGAEIAPTVLFSDDSTMATSNNSTSSPSPQTPALQDYNVDRQFLAATLAAAAKAASSSCSPSAPTSPHSISKTRQHKLSSNIAPHSLVSSTTALLREEFDIVHYPVKHTTLIVSALLSSMVNANDQRYNPLVDPITLFHSRAVPRISIEAYLTRILQYIPFSNEVLLNVLVYLDRIGGLSGMEQICGSGDHSEEVEEEQESPRPSMAPRPSPSNPLSTSTTTPLSHSPSSSEKSPQIIRSNDFGTSPTRSSPTSAPFSSQLSTCSMGAIFTAQDPCPGSSDLPPAPSSSSTTFNRIPTDVKSYSRKDPVDALPAAPSLHPRQPNSDWPMIQKRARDAEEPTSSTAPSTALTPTPTPIATTTPTVTFPGPTGGSHNSLHRSTSKESPPAPDSGSDCPHGQESEEDHCRHVPKKTKLDGKRPNMSSSAQDSTPTVQSHSSSTLSSSTGSTRPNGSWTPAPTPVLAMTSNGFRINSFNIHRLLIVCLMVAAKFTSDHFYSNVRYSKVGGLSLLELNQLELEFLFTTRFELNVKEEELQRVGNALLRFRDKETAPTPQRVSAKRKSVQETTECSRPSSIPEPMAVINTATVSGPEGTNGHSTQGLQQGPDARQQNEHHLQHQKSGRFSIPSPTSPRNGPMSDRVGSSTASTTGNSGSTGSGTTNNADQTVAASTDTASATAGDGTVVIVSSGSQDPPRPQLLSPPAERQRRKDGEVTQGSERPEGTAMGHGKDAPRSSASLSSAKEL
ncbi:hypothetical protein EMPS_07074 [Entomortierella parvispora]|uniref:Cyclin-domain-containing protein n=1 Tax=Entomortierella parvispora TaxID=205924 RepID=A0A9P3HDR1_9FUNG|nr:hypothetical protein EMPS_07074 [Entomortierella parvispora]